MKRILLICVLTLLVLLLACPAAFAHGKNTTDTAYYDKTSTSTDCAACHYLDEFRNAGPHGGYTDSTDKCQVCHKLHAQGAGADQGAQNASLLMGETVTEACNFCHNLTASNFAPYNKSDNMIAAAGHRVVGINFNGLRSNISPGDLSIPGGALDGGTGTLSITDQGKLSGNTFTCNSCHTPHGVDTVEPYLGESVTYALPNKIYLTTRLLKSKPNAAGEAITTYGSAWCAACHQGRSGNPTGHYNHPVDMNTPAYKFLDLAINRRTGQLFTETEKQAIMENGVITIGSTGDVAVDPRTNKQYAMAATNELTGKAMANGYVALNSNGPTCQQCHASSRDLSLVFKGVATGTTLANNPNRGNFPHISDKAYLLIQGNSDSFCANCHAPSLLP